MKHSKCLGPTVPLYWSKSLVSFLTAFGVFALAAHRTEAATPGYVLIKRLPVAATSVSISRTTGVIGVRDAVDIGGRVQGSAQVFEQDAGGASSWGQTAVLISSNPQTDAQFGASVSVDGDIVVVGAAMEHTFGFGNQGAAYVFERNPEGSVAWRLIKRLTPSGAAEGDFFGASVAVSENVILVGAFGRNAAFVFERHAGGSNNWGQTKTLLPAGGSAAAFFGRRTSVSGDVIVVGAHSDDIGTNIDQGSAYAFERNAGGLNNWGQVRKLIATNGAAGDLFGSSVAVSQDTIVIGAPDMQSTFEAGSAFVFERNAGGPNNWGQVRKLVPADATASDAFGESVSVSGNVVVVGATPYVFERNAGGTGNWGEIQKLGSTDGTGGDFFGASVSTSGNLIFVAAPAAFASYVFFIPSLPLILEPPAAQTNLLGTSASFRVTAVGEPPLTYQWFKDNAALVNGGRVSGVTSSNLAITRVALADAGTYAVAVSNSLGSVTSLVATLTVIDLNQGVETTNLVWSSGEGESWFYETAATHDGVDALQSHSISDGGESWVQTTVTGPGTLGFWWKVSSEMDYDTLEFSLNGIVQWRISGEEDWTRVAQVVPSGTSVLRWHYRKDSSTALGQDRAWLDEVMFVPESGPPVIVSQPVSRRAGLGDSVTFVAGVGGALPRTLQWFYDGSPIVGATNTTRSVNNVGPTHAGSYHLVVSNAFGAATSSIAGLTITTNARVQSVLLLADDATGSLYRRALGNLGLSYQLFTDFGTFNLALSAADPVTTLAVVDSYIASHSLNPLGRFAESGGRAILQYWGLNVGSSLAQSFNASVSQIVTTPLGTTPIPVYDWGEPAIFRGLPNPVTFIGSYDFDGQRLTATAGGRAVGGFVAAPASGQAAIVVGHSGRTILNGCLLEESVLGLNLAESEIQWLAGVTTPPFLIQLPTDLVCRENTPAGFSIVAGGSVPRSYQWLFNGTTPIPGAINSSLNLPSVQLNQGGVYSVVVSNAYGSVTSNPALLAVAEQAVMAYEGFDYSPGGTMLENRAGGFGFSSPWFGGAFNSTVSTNFVTADTSLVVPGLRRFGHRIRSASSSSIGGVNRQLNRPMGISGTTHYVSFVLRPEGTVGQGASGGFFGLSLIGTGPDLFVGKPSNLGRYGLESIGGTGQVSSPENVVAGSNVLLVVRAQFLDGNDRFTLYVNPQPGGAEPAGGVVKSDIDMGTVFAVALYSGGAFAIDELRITESYASAVSAYCPPEVIQAPASTSAAVGLPVSLSIVAAGPTPLIFQWQRNGTNLVDGSNVSGTGTAQVTLNPAAFEDSGAYRVVVGSSCGGVTSQVAQLLVQPLVITSQPRSQSVRIGNNATSRVEVASALPVSYQWRFNGTNLPGATNSSLVLNAIDLSDEGEYSVQVRNELGSFDSSNAALVVLIPPLFIQPPLSQFVAVGGDVTFSAQFSGHPPPFTSEWRRVTAPFTINTSVSDDTKSFFTLKNVRTNDAGNYRLILKCASGPAVGIASPVVTLSVLMDTDEDGLPDEWEAAYPAASEAGLDADGDGRTNLEEYRAGTIPTDAGSCLRIESIAYGSFARLEFPAASNQTYTVQHSDQLGSGVWSKLLDVVARPTNRTEIVTDPNAAFRPNRTYRVVAPRQP